MEHDGKFMSHVFREIVSDYSSFHISGQFIRICFGHFVICGPLSGCCCRSFLFSWAAAGYCLKFIDINFLGVGSCFYSTGNYPAGTPFCRPAMDTCRTWTDKCC